MTINYLPHDLLPIVEDMLETYKNSLEVFTRAGFHFQFMFIILFFSEEEKNNTLSECEEVMLPLF